MTAELVEKLCFIISELIEICKEQEMMLMQSDVKCEDIEIRLNNIMELKDEKITGTEE